mmetsp:Transcript_5143/g.9665  ORF Transcript_5143/g.9665 Transcript_5143/m.9665 type:complete len:232 (+) Transcript_5143:793-1488(+)
MGFPHCTPIGLRLEGPRPLRQSRPRRYQRVLHRRGREPGMPKPHRQPKRGKVRRTVSFPRRRAASPPPPSRLALHALLGASGKSLGPSASSHPLQCKLAAGWPPMQPETPLPLRAPVASSSLSPPSPKARESFEACPPHYLRGQSLILCLLRCQQACFARRSPWPWPWPSPPWLRPLRGQETVLAEPWPEEQTQAHPPPALRVDPWPLLDRHSWHEEPEEPSDARSPSQQE